MEGEDGKKVVQSDFGMMMMIPMNEITKYQYAIWKTHQTPASIERDVIVAVCYSLEFAF